MIKKIIFFIIRLVCNAVYAVMKLFSRPQDMVLFLSRQSDSPSADFKMLAEEIQRQSPSTRIEFSCKLGLKSEMGLSYMLLMLRQMSMLSRAKTCVTESFCPPISILRHRRELKIIQIWHSMVAIKKFGWQTLDTEEGSSSAVAEGMRMHNGYTYIIVGSEYMRSFFAEAMKQDIEKILPLGSAHADAVLGCDKEDARRRIEAHYPQIRGKKLVVYAPTMRRGEAVDCGGLVDNFDYGTAELMIKLHPLDSSTIISDKRVILDRDFPTMDAICAADAVISDYSGVCADALLLQKPFFFFTPDLERYSKRCGLNVDPCKVFPEISFKDAEKLVDAIAHGLSEGFDRNAQAHAAELLAGGCDGNSTSKIAQLILQ